MANDIAEVRLWGGRVGALSFDRVSGLAAFEYAPEWLETGLQLFPLHMPLRKAPYTFSNLPFETYRGLPAGLADVLPDDFGNAVINAWLDSKGRDPSSFSPVERLLYIGMRGMGGLEFLPVIDADHNQPVGELQLGSLVAVAQRILDERGKVNVNLAGDDQAINALVQIGTSAGGARAKAVIAMNADKTSVLSGQIDVPEGYKHYLLKFDGITEQNSNKETFGDPQGFGRMEYAYYLMALDAGVSMMPCELLELDGLAHFITERFDRLDGAKLHYQSLCAMDHADFKVPGSYSYESLLRVARSLGLSRDEQIEIYRRMVFNVVARNQDDHAKNFGFLMGGDGKWVLAPAFDIVYSYKKDSLWVSDHQLLINNINNHFTREDLLAACSSIPRFTKQANAIIDDVIAVVSQWSRYATESGVFSELKKEVAENIRLDI